MLVRAASLLMALGVPWACAWGAPPLTVCSGGAKPIQLTMAKLSKLPQLTITVTFKTSRGLSTGSFTGPSLWTVPTDARALDPTKPRGFVGDTILTTGQDGYVAAVAAGEIAPQFETKNIILAEQVNGKPLGQFHLRLVVPGDKFGGRSVKDVVSLKIESPHPQAAPQSSKP